jgi:hypothetical protein
MRPRRIASRLLAAGTCERSRSEPCPLTMEVFWGLATPGIWASRLEVKVYTSTQSLNSDISAVFAVMNGPDPHTISKWTQVD